MSAAQLSATLHSGMPLVKHLTPALNINKPKNYNFISGLSMSRQQQIETQSVSGNQLSFNYQVPSNIVVGRQMLLKYQLYLTFTGTSESGNLLDGISLTDAIRSFPLQSCCQTESVQLNSATISLTNPNQVIQAFLRFEDVRDFCGQYSMGFGYQDQYANYDDYLTLGQVKNSLSNYGESEVQHRGCIDAYDIITNAPTSASVRITITEPLLISPLLFGRRSGPAFANVTTLNVNLSYTLNRVWSHSSIAGKVITAFTCGIGVTGGAEFNPSLMIDLLTPDLAVPEAVPIKFNVDGSPHYYSYEYNNIQVDPYVVSGAVTAGSDKTVTVNSYQYGFAPKALLIYVKQFSGEQISMSSPNYFAVTSCDNAARIKQLSIAINGSGNYLAEASEENLYDMSVKNGLRQDFYGWRYGAGSYLLLQLGTDIPLPQGIVPGAATQLTFQVQGLTFTNQTSASQSYEVIVAGIGDGLYEIAYSTSNLSNVALSATEAMLLPVTLASDFPDPRYGSGFFGDLWSGIKKAASTVYNVGKKLAPIVSPLVRPLVGQILKGGAKSRGRPKMKAPMRRRGPAYMRGGVKIEGTDFLDENIENYEEGEE